MNNIFQELLRPLQDTRGEDEIGQVSGLVMKITDRCPFGY